MQAVLVRSLGRPAAVGVVAEGIGMHLREVTCLPCLVVLASLVEVEN